MKPMTRVLVLAGIVTLAHALGVASGYAADPLSVEDARSAVKQTVAANSDFAIALYKQLAAEDEDTNLFFSPYSISSALAITTEGARGNTAAEIGKVLRYPETARRIGDDARLIPWRTALIHKGFQQLNQAMQQGPSEQEDLRMRKEIIARRAKFGEIREAANAAFKAGDLKKSEALRKEAYENAAEAGRLIELLPDRLSIANALWAEQSYRIEQTFLETIDKYYETGAVKGADFRGNAEAERGRINSWVSDRTGGHINDMIPGGVLNELTRMVLVNAVYFKGAWTEPFERKNTRNGVFTLADGTETQATFMHADDLESARYGAFRANGDFFRTPRTQRRDQGAYYPDKNGFAMAELPYKSGKTSMVLMAPMAHDGLRSVEKLLTSPRLTTWLSKLETREMRVKMPKFKMEATYNLGQSGGSAALQKLGIKQAFVDPRRPDGADFSGIHDSEDPGRRLFIDQVLHKTLLSVNEEGTVAAGATAVAYSTLDEEPAFVPAFRADRPFLLLIRHNTTGTILFMGRILNPGTADADE